MRYSRPYAVRYSLAVHQPTGTLLDGGRERVVPHAFSTEDALFLVRRTLAGTQYDAEHVRLENAQARAISTRAARRIPIAQMRLL